MLNFNFCLWMLAIIWGNSANNLTESENESVAIDDTTTIDWNSTFLNQLKIVGGIPTEINKFPHQISLRYQGAHRCGGSIINRRCILTAAHCVQGTILRNRLTIRAGSTYLNGGSGFLDRFVIKVLIHERYSSRSMNNDVAILLLNNDLEFSNSIQPIPMASYNERIEEGRLVYVSGWGALAEGQRGSNHLSYVGINIASKTRCQQQYIGHQITNSMICAGTSNGGKDSCQGDSGGPLVVQQDGKQKLVGVVSWGIGCGRREYYGIYADVAALRYWIDQKLSTIDLN